MLELLRRLSKLLKYKPGKTTGRKYMQYYMLASEYLELKINTYNNAHWRDEPFTP